MELMDLIKMVRTETGLSLKDCRAAAADVLKTANGSDEKVLLRSCIDFLRSKGKDKAMKKGARSTAEGYFGSYIHHNGKIAVLVEVNCETDFVARNDDFQAFIKQISLHIAGLSPIAVDENSITEETIQKEREIYKNQVVEEGKPEAMHDKIIEGKLKAYYKASCLVHQAMLGDNDNRTVKQVMEELISKSGENIKISRFVRWDLGK